MLERAPLALGGGMTALTAPDAPAVRRLLQDLAEPDERAYWLELVLSTGALAATLAFAARTRGLPMLLLAAAALGLLLHRTASFMHELVHLPASKHRALLVAWNVLWGVPFLLPSWMYRRIHFRHHHPDRFATAADPELQPLTTRGLGALAGGLMTGLLLPFGLALRFLVVGPLSWGVPPLRRLVLAWGSTLTSNHLAPERWSAPERGRIVLSELAAAGLWWSALALMETGRLQWRVAAVVLLGWMLAMALHQVRLLCNHRLLDHSHPRSEVGVTLESYTVAARGLQRLILPLGAGYHALHHLAPAVPFHHLEQAHARLLRALPEDSAYRLTVVPGIRSALADHVRMAGSRAVEQPAFGAGPALLPHP